MNKNSPTQSILIVSENEIECNIWHSLLGDLFPGSEFFNAKSPLQAETYALQASFTGAIVCSERADVAFDLLSNLRMFDPHMWSFTSGVEIIDSLTAKALGVLRQFAPKEKEATLFRAVGEALSTSNEDPCLLRGSLVSLPLTDLIQMKSLIGKPARIRLLDDAGHEAWLGFSSDGLCDCRFEGLSGEEAFYKISHWNKGIFEEMAVEGKIRKSILIDWRHLLMDAATRSDEGEVAYAQ